jgi:hypothetical protein
VAFATERHGSQRDELAQHWQRKQKTPTSDQKNTLLLYKEM